MQDLSFVLLTLKLICGLKQFWVITSFLANSLCDKSASGC